MTINLPNLPKLSNINWTATIAVIAGVGLGAFRIYTGDVMGGATAIALALGVNATSPSLLPTKVAAASDLAKIAEVAKVNVPAA